MQITNRDKQICVSEWEVCVCVKKCSVWLWGPRETGWFIRNAPNFFCARLLDYRYPFTTICLNRKLWSRNTKALAEVSKSVPGTIGIRLHSSLFRLRYFRTTSAARFVPPFYGGAKADNGNGDPGVTMKATETTLGFLKRFLLDCYIPVHFHFGGSLNTVCVI